MLGAAEPAVLVSPLCAGFKLSAVELGGETSGLVGVELMDRGGLDAPPGIELMS